jgi:hypothetical protein
MHVRPSRPVNEHARYRMKSTSREGGERDDDEEGDVARAWDGMGWDGVSAGQFGADVDEEPHGHK